MRHPKKLIVGPHAQWILHPCLCSTSIQYQGTENSNRILRKVENTPFKTGSRKKGEDRCTTADGGGRDETENCLIAIVKCTS